MSADCGDASEDDGPVPHAQVRAYLAALDPVTGPWSAPIAAVRADARERVLAVRGELEHGGRGTRCSAERRARPLIRPRAEDDGVLVWAHGGAWMHGDLDCTENVARALADRAGCAVLAIDYRLAPEHPFPAGFDDMWAALEWARGRYGRVAVGGDSSGGNLAAATALKARDTGVDLAAQVLVYPVLDSRDDTSEKREFAQRYQGFSGQPDYGRNTYLRLQHIWQAYVPDAAQRSNPYAVTDERHRPHGVAPQS